MKSLHIAILSSLLFASACASPNVRLMTYNIHHGRGLDGQVDLERIAELIRESGADIVALNEVDKGTQRTDGRDLAAELAKLCGMRAVFEHNIDFQGGEYGNALLTRFPILHHENHHYAMLRPGEQRGLLKVKVNAHGRDLRIWVTHIDHRRDDAERVANVGEIVAMLKDTGQPPVILCGDFNDTPGSRTHTGLTDQFTDCWSSVGTGPGLTYKSDTPSKRIDYVFLQKEKGLAPVAASVPTSHASDHLPLVVEIHLQ